MNVTGNDLFAVILRKEAPDVFAPYTDSELRNFYLVWLEAYCEKGDKLQQFVAHCEKKP